MKKAIALALSLAAATSANAALETGQGQSAGEMFLTVWNSATETSFTYDLGLGVAAFNDSSQADFSINLNASAMAHIAGNSADISWNIAGAHTVNPQNFAELAEYGVYWAGGAGTVTRTKASIDSQPGVFAQYVSFADDGTNVGTTADPIYLLTGGSVYAGNGAVWGGTMGGTTTWAGAPSAAHSVGDIVNGQIYGQAFDGSSLVFDARTDAKSWSFSISEGGVGTLTYGAAVVPVPAAAWLFGSALMGLATIGRRRKA